MGSCLGPGPLEGSGKVGNMFYLKKAHTEYEAILQSYPKKEPHKEGSAVVSRLFGLGF